MIFCEVEISICYDHSSLDYIKTSQSYDKISLCYNEPHNKMMVDYNVKNIFYNVVMVPHYVI